MNEKKRTFWGAFSITLILLFACAGFIAVDLSADRYMPGQFGSFFEITGVTPGCLEFTCLAKDYRLTFSFDRINEDILARLRGLLPASPLIGAETAARAAQYFLDS